MSGALEIQGSSMVEDLGERGGQFLSNGPCLTKILDVKMIRCLMVTAVG